MCTALALSLALLAQNPAPKEISADAWQTADRFFAANGGAPADRPIVRRVFATYIEASRAYKVKDYKHCLETLDEMWRDRPIGDPRWARADMRPSIYSLGNPACYPSLLMLDEAVRWRLQPDSAKVKPNPILMDVILFGHSEGIQPRTADELANNQGRQAYHDLDRTLLKDDYARVRNSLWLFQDYILAITKGRANLEIEFVYLPEESVHMETSVRKQPNGMTGFAIPNETLLTAQLERLRRTLKRQPDWWWVLYPSHVPDQYPDFKTTEFITGGNTAGPDGRSMRLEIDDKWLVRRPGFLGQGAYDPLELEAYIPYWLCHEFYHHVYARFPEFELEKTGHDWHDRKKWPSDFQGVFEPDYYRESLHRRILSAQPGLNQRLRYNPPTPQELAKVDLKEVLGTYRLGPGIDGWHTGEIVLAGRDENGNPVLAWKNQAGVSWPLYPDMTKGNLITGKENPYMKEPQEAAHQFTLALHRDESGRFTGQVEGYWFLGEYWRKL